MSHVRNMFWSTQRFYSIYSRMAPTVSRASEVSHEKLPARRLRRMAASSRGEDVHIVLEILLLLILYGYITLKIIFFANFLRFMGDPWGCKGEGGGVG